MKLTPFNFPTHPDRPYLLTSFVSSIDGKIIVKEKGYWPIGTQADKEYFTYLRAHADAIVDAKNTALRFGKYTIRTLHDDMYNSFRKELGKEGKPQYIVVTSNPDEELKAKLANEHGYTPKYLTPEDGSKRVSITQFISYLNAQGHKTVFINGGPIFIAQLLEAGILDEIHLTIAPKVFGSAPGKTLTMVEGILLPADNLPKFELLSVDRLEDEVVLRYKTLT